MPRNLTVPGLFSFCFLCVRDLLLRIVADGLAQTPQIRAEGHDVVGVGQVEIILVEMSASLCWMTASSLSKDL